MNETTRPITAIDTTAALAEPLAWCLTLVFHPDLRRIGEQAWVPATARTLPVGRAAPQFADPFAGTSECEARGIGDQRISRDAFVLQRADGGWWLRRGRGPLRVDGSEQRSDLFLGPQRLRSGVTLTLSHSVLLFLRLTDALPASVAAARPPAPMIGVSPAMRHVYRAIAAAALDSSDVLLLGATGTGKELVARAIHALSARCESPWLAINLSALPPELAAASLFGVRRGAYTGADRDRPGYFQQASGGTLFLDEVGDAPAAVQPLLLRALQEREVQVIGGKPQSVELRVVAATEIDPDTVGSNFRAALRFRLGAIELRLPTLGERREDIGPLAVAVIEQAAARGDRSWDGGGTSQRAVTGWARCFEALLLADWPGNVRQLVHCVRRVYRESDGDRIVPPTCGLQRSDDPAATAEGSESESDSDSDSVHEQPLCARGLHALSDGEFLHHWRSCDYQVTRVARALGVSRQAVYRRLQVAQQCRLASEVPLDELVAALQACRGDLKQTARRLEVSAAGLRTRLGTAGVTARDNPRSVQETDRQG